MKISKVVFAVMVVGVPGAAVLFLIVVLFLIFGLALLAIPVGVRLKRRRTIYVATDQRLLIISGLSRRSVKSFEPADIDFIERRERRDGSGTVFFAREERSGGKGGTYTVKIGFSNIPSVKEVERYIMELKEMAR